ncbi:hypothetical protein IQ277_24750 [Nostocales cyanobacterium LEGE 12452]|nr:hypothetical protein [Nostocales cyanobacterium LEGE 12452]
MRANFGVAEQWHELGQAGKQGRILEVAKSFRKYATPHNLNILTSSSKYLPINTSVR